MVIINNCYYPVQRFITFDDYYKEGQVKKVKLKYGLGTYL